MTRYQMVLLATQYAKQRSQRRNEKLLCILLFIAGLVLLFNAGYIHAKAWLGQQLLERAWATTQSTQEISKAWSWADSYPVARLSAPQYKVDILVLHGANGEALAWGAGWLPSSAPVGSTGTTVFAAHRDTHFRFLQKLHYGDKLRVEDAQRRTIEYQVERISIVDVADLRLPADDGSQRLMLVTCYPFAAIQSGNLRYVVEAGIR